MKSRSWWVGSLVDLPPDGLSQDLGEAPYGRCLVGRVHAEHPLQGRGGKGYDEEMDCIHLSQHFQTGT